MMEGINLARVDAANYACGFLKAAIRECSVGANNRIAFGKPLSDLQTIQIKIGQMATDYEAARLLTLAASNSFALGKGGDPILLSKAKLFSTDAAMKHAVEALQIFGAIGPRRPPQQSCATLVPRQQGRSNLCGDRLVGAAAQLFVGQHREPSFDLVEPGQPSTLALADITQITAQCHASVGELIGDTHDCQRAGGDPLGDGRRAGD
jgi:acyl-CoA dehydrogenase-like protein